MKRRVWKRVVSRQQLTRELMPGLVLAVLCVGTVSAAVVAPEDTSGDVKVLGDSMLRTKKPSDNAKEGQKAKAAPKQQNAKIAPVISSADVVQLGSPLANTVDGMISRQMWFIATPTSAASAKELAQDAAVKLAELSRANIQSLAVLEPLNTSGSVVDFGTYQSGGYDAFFNIFYSELKARGITDEAMGMWVIMPEANMPEWGQSDPGVISACITRTAQLQKQHFPKSLTTILLNSQTYPGNDITYSQGRFSSLSPYVQNIPKGLIDSFGYQGFPWARPANQAGPSSLDPAEFLRNDIATEGARALGTRSIWFNTGSFAAMHAGDPSKTVTASTEQRLALLNGIHAQVVNAQQQGFNVAVNMFMEDKSRVAEGTDWSFGAIGSRDYLLFQEFENRLRLSRIGLWRFQ